MFRFQTCFFDNVRNTRGTFKTLLNIYYGASANLVNNLKPLAINTNNSIIGFYHGFECANERNTKEVLK